jgi:hypothetical protein
LKLLLKDPLLFNRRNVIAVVIVGWLPVLFITLQQLALGVKADAGEWCAGIGYAYLFSLTATTVLFFGNTFLIHRLHDRLPWSRQAMNRLLAEFFICIPFSAVAMTLVAWLFNSLLFHAPMKPFIVNMLVIGTIMTVIVTLFEEGRFFFREWKTELVRSEQLKKEMAESQYEALKSQVSPHFLFNSLNSLTALVHKNPDKAIEFINEFSKIYRYVLEVSGKVVVELSQELDFLQSYFFLQKIRFGENLKIEINVASEKLQEFVPPLSLQLLAENAIKHNEISTARPLHIFISTEENFLVVKNDLQLRDEKVESTGIGLKNLSSRYELISELIPSFSANGEYFVARIPLIET